MVERYIKLAESHAQTDDSDGSAVAKTNRLANEMIDIAYRVGRDIPAEDFATLLDNPVAKKWAAHHLIEIVGVTDELLEKSLHVITEVANSDDADAFGEQIWLQLWEQENSGRLPPP